MKNPELSNTQRRQLSNLEANLRARYGDPVDVDGIPLFAAREREVLPQLAQWWQQGHKGFKGILPPEYTHRPAEFNLRCTNDETERLKAVFIFLQAFSQRSGKTADKILGSLNRWWHKHPELFDPCSALEETDLFSQMVREVDPRGNEDEGFRELAWWQRVMRTLREEAGGDPRQFFYQMRAKKGLSDQRTLHEIVLETRLKTWEGVDTARTIIEQNLVQLDGVKLKVASMFVIFFQGTQWSDNQEFWELFEGIPFVPFDIHHIRFYKMLGLISGTKTGKQQVDDGYRDYLSSRLSHHVSKLCFELGINHSDLAQAIYNTGARIHAEWNRARNNSTRQAEICHHNCPLHAVCVQVVQADRGLNDKKSRRARNTHTLSLIRGSRTTRTTITLPMRSPQPPLDPSWLPTEEEALAERELIGTETQGRGAILRFISPRPLHGITGSVLDSPGEIDEVPDYIALYRDPS